MQEFVVLSLQRSGSHFLTSSLNTHPNIFVGGEFFKRREPIPDTESLDDYFDDVFDSVKALAQRKKKNIDAGCIGFILHLSQI